MGLTGCYVLHIYCDHEEHMNTDGGILDYNFFCEITNNTENKCIKEAKNKGWTIKDKKDGEYYCLCPYHSKKVK